MITIVVISSGAAVAVAAAVPEDSPGTTTTTAPNMVVVVAAVAAAVAIDTRIGITDSGAGGVIEAEQMLLRAMMAGTTTAADSDAIMNAAITLTATTAIIAATALTMVAVVTAAVEIATRSRVVTMPGSSFLLLARCTSRTGCINIYKCIYTSFGLRLWFCDTN